MGSFGIWHWMIILAVVFVVWKAVKDAAPGAAVYCGNCGHEGPAKRVTRGHFLIELVLWLAFIVPGLVYSIWRMTTRHQACRSCGSTALMSPNSPVALSTKKRLQS